MTFKLNEDGTHYLKWTFLNQVWVRYNNSNPGTVVLGESAPETVDIGLRRTRIQFFGQISDHVFFYSQFGQNNFNFLAQNNGNRKLQVFFHDAVTEFKVWKENNWLKVGTGLTINNGLSRFTQPSVSSIMTMDVPVFAQATVDQIDEFSRKLSLYLRGQVLKLDYRLVMSDPFPVTTNGQTVPELSQNASFSRVGHHKQWQAFLAYNFFEKEPHTTPYMTGTHLGKLRVLNLEGGFITQKKATETGVKDDLTGVISDNRFYNLNLWSIAVYYDAPLRKEKGNAMSAYVGYFHTDYGPGYLRYNGIMNPASSSIISTAPGSQGNGFPMFGTGDVIYTQLGYLTPINGFDSGRVLPYLSMSSAGYSRIHGRVNVFDVGVNWLLKDHRSKITVDFQNRPYYQPVSDVLEEQGRKSQLVIQYQILI